MVKKLPKPETYKMNLRKKGTKKGNNGKEYRFNLRKKKWTKKQVDQAVQRQLKSAFSQMGRFNIGVTYWIDKQYSSDVYQINSKKDIDKIKFKSESFMQDYDGETEIDEDDVINMMSMYFIPVAKSKVGSDKHNDCLYNCLKESFYELPEVMKSPSVFKQYFGYERDDKMELERLSEYEDKLKLNISTSGEFKYESDGKYPRSTRLFVRSGHVQRAYAIDDWKKLTYGYRKTKQRRYPIFFKVDLENDAVKMCMLENGKNGDKITFTKPVSYLRDFYTTNPFRFKYFLKKVEIVNKLDEDGKKMYNEKDRLIKYQPEPEDVIESELERMEFLREMAFKMLGHRRRESFNPYHSQFKLGPIATQFWLKHVPKVLHNVDDYDVEEEQWLSNAMGGGVIYADPCELKKGYEYDVNSMYPYLMTKVDFITRKGEFKTITEIPKIKNPYVIVRCKITNYNDKLFQPNKHNFYCGLDVKTALKEGYDIELIQDGKPNYLVYGKNTRITGEEIFGSFVKNVYFLKSSGVQDAKMCLNYLWGYLSSKSTYEVNTDDADYDVDRSKIKTIFPRGSAKNGEQHYTYRMYKNHANGQKRQFNLKYSRFAPFLTCKGRRMIYKAVKPVQDNVVRVHTDGFISKKRCDGFENSTAIGKYKMKKGKVKIKNANNIRWG